LEIYFFTIKSFWKAGNKLGDLNTIYWGFLKPFWVLKIGFRNSFTTVALAFQHGFWPIRTSKNFGKPQINL
jgi:hypothetical protein